MACQLDQEAHGVFYRCVEDSNDAIMLTNQEGILIYVNPAWSAIYGYSREEVLGRSPALIRSKHQDPAFYKKMWADILNPSKAHWRGELINRAKDGREVPVLLTITPFYGSSDQLEGYMGIALDMSEKRQMEAQMLQQDRLASIGLLASGLAHEIGTPLGVIRGRAEYIAMQASGNAKIIKGLDIIMGQIDRISKLIYGLLNYARIDSHTAITPVAIHKVIQSVSVLLGQQMSRSEIQLKVHFGPEVVVKADVDRLEQVFMTLLLNAIYAIEEKIRMGIACDREINITAQKQDQLWHIQVADSGVGITSENLKHVFKPFFSTKPVGSGTGLGLAVVSRTIESWKGSIWAESEPNQGATIHIKLPI